MNTMELSKFLSKVIGIYLIIVSANILLNTQEFMHRVSSLINDPSLMFVTGFFTLILGILTVVAHNIWQWHWRVIITIVAWLTLIKGASIILYPAFIDNTTHLFLENNKVAFSAGCFDLALGILLCYFGFKHK